VVNFARIDKPKFKNPSGINTLSIFCFVGFHASTQGFFQFGQGLGIQQLSSMSQLAISGKTF
jgi:hypothetical protein